MAYIASQKCKKYQTNLNNMITLREKEELNKTELFGSQKHGARFSLCTVNFAIIAKNSGIAKIQIFAMHSSFRYDSEFSL